MLILEIENLNRIQQPQEKEKKKLEASTDRNEEVTHKNLKETQIKTASSIE